MPRIVNAEGQTFSFPDDASQEEITSAVNSALPAKPAEPQKPQSSFGSDLVDTVKATGQDALNLERNMGASLAQGVVGAVRDVGGSLLGAGSNLLQEDTMGQLSGGKLPQPLRAAQEGLVSKAADAQNYLEGLKTPEMQAENKALTDTKGALPTTGYALTHPSTIGDQFVQSVPEMAMMAGSVASAAKTAFTKAIEAGLDKVAAREVAIKAATEAELAVNAAGEGAPTNLDTRQQIMSMPRADLMKNQDYVDLEKQYGELEARRILADKAAPIAGTVAGTIGAAATKFSGAGKLEAEVLAGDAAKPVGSLAAEIAKGAGKEYSEEFAQSAGDQLGQNIGNNAAGIDTPVMNQVLEQGAVGGLTGVVGGVGFGAMHKAEGNSTPPPEDVQGTIDAFKAEIASAREAGDTQKAEVGQNILNHLLDEFGQSDNTGQSLNQSPAQEIPAAETPTSPEREALLATDEPLSEEELQARVKAAQAQVPPAPEQLADGTTALGVNDAIPQQIGNTQKVRLNSEPYTPNPNDEVPRDQRQILFGPDGTVGQTLSTVKTQPGTYTIGQPSVDRSADVLSGTHDLYEELRQRFMPDATFIISNEGTDNTQSIGEMRKLQSGEYLFVPAFARQFSSDPNIGTQDAETFNKHTKAKAFYNIFHEFGHALTIHRFFEGVAPDVQMRFMQENQSDNGLISENTISQMPEAQADLAREYNQMRQDVMTKNMTWFQHEWMSPALAVQRQLSKENRAMADTNAYSFIRRLVARGNPQVLDMQVRMKFATTPEERIALSQQIDKIVTKMANDYLSFDEFMAEKMARYAHETGLGHDSALASGELFGGGITHVRSEESIRTTGLNSKLAYIQKSLRKLFIALKQGIKTSQGTYRISAGTSFAKWLESLGKVGQKLTPTKIATQVSAASHVTVAPSITTPQGQPLPQVANTTRVRELNRAVTFGRFSPKEKQELYKLIRQNAVNSVQERMIEMLQSRVKLQLDTESEFGVALTGGEEAQKAWQKQHEQSPFFKNWFGDWENDPQTASKVMSVDGKPLIYYHATRADIEKFTKGDIGFHFGDLIAAHARLYTSTPKDVAARIALDEWRGQRNAEGGDTLRAKDSGMNIIPVYLNIRNPLELDEQNFEQIWEQPSSMALFLEKQGILSKEELDSIHAQAMDFMQRFSITDAMLRSEGAPNIRYQMFQPLRKLLQNKGYDGIKYKNAVEGSTSWVAFSSGQIKTANGTFNPLDTRIHMQRDLDLTTETGLALDTISRKAMEFENMGFMGQTLHFFGRLQWYTLQLQQLAHIHPEYHFLDLLNSAAMQYTAVKSKLQAMGEGLVQVWKNVGKENEARLAKALEREAEGGVHWTNLQKIDGVWQHTPTEETLTKLAEMGISQDTDMGRKLTELYMQSKNVLVQQLDAARKVLERKLSSTIKDEGQFLMQLNALRHAFNDVRDVPFLPRGDYGQWGIKIVEQVGLERKVIFRQMFESNKDLVRAHAVAEKNLEPGQKIEIVKNFQDEHRPLLALPAEYLDQAAIALEMTQEEKDILHDLLHPIKTEKLLKPYMKAMEKIGGGSKDRMRNFADFVWHNSTMIARTEAAEAFSQAKRAGSQMYRDVDNTPMDSVVKFAMLQDIARAQKFMQGTIDYTLSPPNELYKIRSTIAVIYLFGGIKTALLNFAGLSTTWAALTSQYGELKGDSAIMLANKQLSALLSSGTVGTVDKSVEQLYNRAIAEGFIVQNYAAHLGAAATAGVARRLVNRARWTGDVSTHLGQVADLGMLPFTMVEQYTRRITFLAVVNAQLAEAKAKGLTMDMNGVYEEAIRKTDLLQNSYTLANRPVVMRGTQSPLVPLMTIFLSFMEHFTFHAAGGYEYGNRKRMAYLGQEGAKSYLSSTKRILLFLMLFGGYEALPGAENLLDMLDIIWKKYFYKPFRQELREFTQNKVPSDLPGSHWLNDPRFWARGLGGNVWGYDISSSLGIGKIIPGTDVLANPPQGANEFIGKMLSSVGGVAGSFANWATTTMLDIANGQPIEKDFARFPGLAGNLASAKQWAEDNKVTGSKGETIYTPSTADIVAKAAGFNPAEKSATTQENWAVKEAVQYWTVQRQLLQKAYNTIRDSGDREALADVKARIETFNEHVMDSRMKLRPYQINESYRNHVKEQRQLEAGRSAPNAKNLSADVRASFDGEAESE